MSVGMLVWRGNLVYFWRTATICLAVNPAAAAFHNDRLEIRYVWMCSGLFSSSANGAMASRASAYRGLNVSNRIERSGWTNSGLVGSYVGAVVLGGGIGSIRSVSGRNRQFRPAGNLTQGEGSRVSHGWLPRRMSCRPIRGKIGRAHV